MRGAPLGQHFLNAQWVARDLIQCLDIQKGETVLEIGPGKGALTRKLLEQGHMVLAIEKDPSLMDELRHTCAHNIRNNQLRIIEEDIRNIDPRAIGLSRGTYVVAANIPYYITGEIVRQFLSNEAQPRAMALLMQKEVAQRIVAKKGKESILSLSVKAYGTPSYITSVPASCFNPPPQVDSAILLIEDISRDFFADISEDRFFRLVKTGFASKRKMLAGNLKPLVNNPHDALTQCGVDRRARAEDVSLAKWKCLAK